MSTAVTSWPFFSRSFYCAFSFSFIQKEHIFLYECLSPWLVASLNASNFSVQNYDDRLLGSIWILECSKSIFIKFLAKDKLLQYGGFFLTHKLVVLCTQYIWNCSSLLIWNPHMLHMSHENSITGILRFRAKSLKMKAHVCMSLRSCELDSCQAPYSSHWIFLFMF